jgi:hypothetical protein
VVGPTFVSSGNNQQVVAPNMMVAITQVPAAANPVSQLFIIIAAVDQQGAVA